MAIGINQAYWKWGIKAETFLVFSSLFESHFYTIKNVLRACKSHFRMTEDGAAHATGVVPGNFGENLGLFTK